ncbi:hypothetical protein SDC9_20904 [bioreactor metagenome]|uniref:Lipoprotein n=1 Tax=bioreactor metagenome TaxID=1076179 RepID=A0A644U876_9ZZZZ|nr:hypothetical protein [Negativicutes bacterium]
MKRLSIVTMLCLFLMSMGTVFAQEAGEAVVQSIKKTSYNVAIVPYINSTEERKDYIKEVIDSKYTERFSNKDFQIIPPVDVQKALNSAGYDVSNMELPDKDVLASVAKETNADYVIAMELSQLITTRHMSYFQSKVVTKAKLRYKFYNTAQDKVVSFQVAGTSENKTVFGGVGYKDPITKALNEAMDNANAKIMSNL